MFVHCCRKALLHGEMFHHHVHRAHSYILLPSSTVYGRCGLKRIVHPLDSTCRCIYVHIYVQTHTKYVYTYIHQHTRQLLRESCVAASFNLMRNRLLRSVHTLLEMKHVKQKADRFVSRYVVLCTDRTR